MESYTDIFLGYPYDNTDFSLTLGSIRFIRCSATRESRLFIGRVLFRKRLRGTDCLRIHTFSPKEKYAIDELSRDSSREKFLLNLIDHFLDGNDFSRIVQMPHIFDWIDLEYENNVDFTSERDLKKLYFDYTNYLLSILNTSSVSSPKKLKRGYCHQLQLCLATIISVALEIHLTQVNTWAYRIHSKNKGEGDSLMLDSGINIEDAKLCAARHRYLFVTIADFLLSNSKLPLIVKSDFKLGIDKQIVLNDNAFNIYGFAGTRGKTTDGRIDSYEYCFDVNGNCYDWAVIHERLISEGYSSHDKRYKTIHAAFDRINSINSRLNYHNGWLRQLYNRAIWHFSHALMADSGINLSILSIIPNQEPLKVEREGIYKLLSWKSRASNYKVRMHPKFVFNCWKRYLDLLDWANLQHIANGIHYFAENPPSETPKRVASAFLNNTTNSFWDPNWPTLTSMQWRKYVDYQYLDKSGDIAFTAEFMQHSIQTSVKHYIPFENRLSALRLNDFFESLADTVKLYINKRVPVKVVDNYIGHKTNSGHCVANDTPHNNRPEPKFAYGFTEDPPAPNCKAKLTCFFCEHYALHATVDEIILLLSIREWLPKHSLSKSLNMDEHMIKFEPIIIRIDDIILDFASQNTRHEEIVKKAKHEVRLGNLHPYYGAKLSALETIGL